MGRNIRFKGFLVGRFPKILLRPIFHCSLAEMRFSLGVSLHNNDAALTGWMVIVMAALYGGCTWGTLACAGTLHIPPACQPTYRCPPSV